MLASDLQTSLPLVHRRTSALVAGRLVTHGQSGALVVADDHGRPVGSVSATEILALMTPDHAPATGQWLCEPERLLGELMDDGQVAIDPLTHIGPDDTLHELASRMVGEHSHFAVIDGYERPRFVPLPAVVDAILAMCGDGRDLD